MIGKFSELLFHSKTGLPINTKSLSREMRRVTEKIGMVGYTLYGFRHRVGTLLTNPSKDGARGGNIEYARQLLGHSSMVQTQRYNHSKEADLRATLEIVDKERNLKLKKGG